MTESGDKEVSLAFDANDLLQVVRKLQLEGQTSLLRAFFYLIRALDVDVDFSQENVPGAHELSALSQVSPLCERLVEAYTNLIAKARKEVAEDRAKEKEPDLEDTR